MPRLAQLVAEAVAVCCPYCGEPQPNRDGSEMWTRDDFARLEDRQRRRECVSCEKALLIASEPKVRFD